MMGMKPFYLPSQVPYFLFHYYRENVMKGSWSSMSIIPITLSFVLLFISPFEDVIAAPTRHLCSPDQRDALLEFKNEFEIGKLSPFCIDGRPKTELWGNNSDCCKWEGITCNSKSGHVIELYLSCSGFHGRFHSNTSLQNLPFLITLDLSINDLSGQIPSSFGKLSHLTSLRLSFNHFSGRIPSSIGNLSHLTSLDLSRNGLVGEIPSSFGNLNHLASLDVSSNKLSGNFPISLLNLTELSDISLSYNQFTGMLPPNFTSLSKLSVLNANDNSFTGTSPSSLFTIPSLTQIILSFNQLNGTLEFGNISSPSNLQILGLGSNNFIGPIPSSISKLVNLMLLDLSYLNTQGPVDLSIFSHLKSLQLLGLAYLNTTTTIDLYDVLSYNKRLSQLGLSGNHVSFRNKSSVSSQLLDSLYLSGCGITEFPELLKTQPLLRNLDISNNKINGQVPSWLWKLPNLNYVNLSNNTFTGFERSTKPELSSMRHFLGSNNNFTGKIPSFLCTVRSLSTLDLSENNLHGSIPPCLRNLKTTLSDINLRKNRLSGSLPEDIFKTLRSFDVGHNQLLGKLPRSLIHSSTLQVLNVENNRINDTFPFWLTSLKTLQVLVLRSNTFHGPIHQASFPKLQIIDVSHNHFSGTLPSDYFVKWSSMSSLEKNEDRSKVNYMGDEYGYYHDSMVLRNKGVEMELARILKIYTAIDFSGNNLQGEIPKSIGLLKELHVLNLSNNAFTGHIPSSMGKLKALESLDVSQNKLSGEIPQELGNLSYLAYMNFSQNKLTGLVPGSTQFRRQDCSSFENNIGLYGPSLDEVCVYNNHKPAPKQYEPVEINEEEEEEEVLSWIAAAIGFGPGVVFGITIGYILVSYKPEWFMNPFGPNNSRNRGTPRQIFPGNAR